MHSDLDLAQMIQEKEDTLKNLQQEIYCLTKLKEEIERKQKALQNLDQKGEYIFCPHCGQNELVEKCQHNFLCKICGRFIAFYVADKQSVDILKEHYVYRYQPTKTATL